VANRHRRSASERKIKYNELLEEGWYKEKPDDGRVALKSEKVRKDERPVNFRGEVPHNSGGRGALNGAVAVVIRSKTRTEQPKLTMTGHL